MYRLGQKGLDPTGMYLVYLNIKVSGTVLQQGSYCKSSHSTRLDSTKNNSLGINAEKTKYGYPTTIMVLTKKYGFSHVKLKIQILTLITGSYNLIYSLFTHTVLPEPSTSFGIG
jgi:hypothetical protein